MVLWDQCNKGCKGFCTHWARCKRKRPLIPQLALFCWKFWHKRLRFVRPLTMGQCQSQESFGFEILGSLPPWKLTLLMSEMAPTAQSSVWQEVHSEILMVTVMITNEAGFFSEQNMVAWGLLYGKWHSVFIVIREEIVIAKSSWESLMQRRGLRNDKSERPPSPRKPWVVSRQCQGEQQSAWRRWRQGRQLGNPSSCCLPPPGKQQV